MYDSLDLVFASLLATDCLQVVPSTTGDSNYGREEFHSMKGLDEEVGEARIAVALVQSIQGHEARKDLGLGGSRDGQ